MAETGEWQVSTEFGILIADKDNAKIAEVNTVENAILMASAPELKEKLVNFLLYFDSMAVYGGTENEDLRVYRDAAELIHKLNSHE